MRSGFTLVEGIVSLSVMVLAAAMVHGLYVSAAQGTSMSVEASDALRSVLIATEFLRTDLGGMTFQKLADLKLPEDGKELGFSVPKRLEPDLYKCDWQAIRYQIETIPGYAGHRLVRSVDDDRQPLANVWLQSFRARYVPPKGARVPDEPIYAKQGVSPFQGYLEITLVGLGGAAGKQTYTASVLHPLTPARTPTPYRLLVDEP